MNREKRYCVAKIKDVDMALTDTEKNILIALHCKVDASRIERRKGLLECVVVESDWPEYEQTFQVIEKRVDEEDIWKKTCLNNGLGR